MQATNIETTPARNALPQLHRSRLIDIILRGLSGQLVLVRAPAGFGKTEALANLKRVLEGRGERVIWLSLTADLEPADVVHVLKQGLDGNGPDGAAEDDPASVLGRIANAGRPVYLILDNAETLTGDATIEWLVTNPPDNLRLVIAGRSLPHMRLSRLRMRGLLAEIGVEDLGFTRSEAQQLLGQWLSREDIEHIWTVLHGWPALTRLALIELERGTAASERQMLLDGSHPILRDFIIEEVLPDLGPASHKLVAATADFDNFTLDIAIDLAGLDHDHHTVREIENMPPLILPEAQQAGWYRPHPVVAQAMMLFQGDEITRSRRNRHIRAAALFAEHGYLEKSVLHASVAGDYDLAVRTIEKAGGVNLFLRSGYTVLRGIVQAVPHDVVLATPSLRLCRAVVLAKSGQVREARAVVDGLIEDTDTGRIPDSPAWNAALEHISSLTGIYEDAGLDAEGIKSLQDLITRERQENTWRLGWIYNNLTIAHTRAGHLDEAQADALRALSCYQEERSSYPQAFMLIHLGYVNYRANRPDAAMTYLRQAVNVIRTRQWSDANLMAIAHVPMAVISYLQGQVQQARQMLESAMPVMARGEGWVDFYAQGYATLARARFLTDGWQAAQEVIQDGLAVADNRALPRLRLMLGVLRVELLTRDEQLDAADTAMRQWPVALSRQPWITARERREATLATARLHLRQGDLTGADEQLAQAAEDARRARRDGLLMRINLLRAETRANLGDHDGALAALEEAAMLAGPGTQVQQFRDEGPQLATAMRNLVRRTGVSRLTRVTSDYLSRVSGPQTSEISREGILSLREAEILSLLAEGLSNKAIARRLDVTEPTVKFHLKNLYSKLGVGRRTLAVSVARASGLLNA